MIDIIINFLNIKMQAAVGTRYESGSIDFFKEC